MKRMYSLPEWNSDTAPFFWLAAAACAVACTMATYFSVRKILAETPAQSLRPKTSDRANIVNDGSNKLWRKLSFTAQWNLRDVFRSRVRSVMGMIGAVSSMALLITAFSLQDTFDDMMQWMFKDIQHYNTQIILTRDADLASAEALAIELDGQLQMRGNADMVVHSNVKTVSVTIIEDTTLYGITDENHRSISLHDGEIAVSRKLASSLGLEPGDVFKWQLSDGSDWITSNADILYVSPMGQGLVMTRKTLELSGLEFRPSSIVSPDKIEPFENKIAAAVHGLSDLEGSWYDSMESLTRITFILMAAAIILSMVVLFNLGLLSFTEKEREFATLKVLGFNYGALRQLLFVQNLWFSIIGILLGIPLGNWLNGQVVTMLSENFDLLPTYTPISLTICAVLVMVISSGTNLTFSKRLRTLDMVTALKSVD